VKSLIINLSKYGTGYILPQYHHHHNHYHYHYLPNIIADQSKPILFADDTSIIITNPGPSKFKEDINTIVDNIND
jgi:hypothetical protein